MDYVFLDIEKSSIEKVELHEHYAEITRRFLVNDVYNFKEQLLILRKNCISIDKSKPAVLKCLESQFSFVQVFPARDSVGHKEIFIKMLDPKNNEFNVPKDRSGKPWRDLDTSKIFLNLKTFDDPKGSSLKNYHLFLKQRPKIEKEKIEEVVLEINYFTTTAGWTPEYIYYVDTNLRTCLISISARIRQETGEDWNISNLFLTPSDVVVDKSKTNAQPSFPWGKSSYHVEFPEREFPSGVSKSFPFFKVSAFMDFYLYCKSDQAKLHAEIFFAAKFPPGKVKIIADMKVVSESQFPGWYQNHEFPLYNISGYEVNHTRLPSTFKSSNNEFQSTYKIFRPSVHPSFIVFECNPPKHDQELCCAQCFYPTQTDFCFQESDINTQPELQTRSYQYYPNRGFVLVKLGPVALSEMFNNLNQLEVKIGWDLQKNK